MNSIYNLRKGRSEWIDMLKGIAIFLVVLGHMSYTADAVFIKNLIYSFHMPLFFILAGCTSSISMNKSNSIPCFIKKRCISVLLPYISWLFLYGFFFTSSVEDIVNYDFENVIHTLIYGSVSNWFLICLFVLQLVYSAYALLTRNVDAIIIKVLCVGFLFCLLTTGHKLWGRTAADSSAPIEYITNAYVYFIPFFLGVAIAEYPSFFKFITRNQLIITVAVIVFIFFSSLIGTIPLNLGNYPKVMNGCMVSILLISATLRASSNTVLRPFNDICRIGKNLFKIFGRHTLGIYLMASCFQRSINPIEGGGIDVFLEYILYSLIICTVCIILEFILCSSSFIALVLFGKTIRKQDKTSACS